VLEEGRGFDDKGAGALFAEIVEGDVALFKACEGGSFLPMEVSLLEADDVCLFCEALNKVVEFVFPVEVRGFGSVVREAIDVVGGYLWAEGGRVEESEGV
jgi:hypothetical protein